MKFRRAETPAAGILIAGRGWGWGWWNTAGADSVAAGINYSFWPAR